MPINSSDTHRHQKPAPNSIRDIITEPYNSGRVTSTDFAVRNTKQGGAVIELMATIRLIKMFSWLRTGESASLVRRRYDL